MKQTSLVDTIAAISTPLISGAISIVRLSGSKAIEIADKVFISTKKEKPSTFPSRLMTLGTFDAQTFKEQCLCVVFRAPNSFTGEDLVEFQCHGGVAVTKGILLALLNNGARMATPGEFSRRAFISGKMSLANAEGMMDMINAESDAQIRAGYSLLSGQMSKLASSLSQKLVDLLSDIEVSLDYPEEDIEYITKEKTRKTLKSIQDELDKTLKTRQAGKLIKEGVSIAILGRPNVGKSSLLNALLKDEKAIVTSVAGTTRDIIEGAISINGLKFNLYDTAGIHETDDEVEKIGVDKAKKIIDFADIILFIKDDENSKQDDYLEGLIKGKNVLTVINKSDKTGDFSVGENKINISALNRKNIDVLENKLYELATKGKNFGDNVILTSSRHYDALKRAKDHIDHALANLDRYSIDVITIDLNLAYSCLGEITGTTTGEDIINAIFSKFCLGK